MTAPPFDLGLGETDIDALRAARRRVFPFDRGAAMRFVAQASARVDEAVRRRPLFTGAPFELPGLAEPGTAGPKEAGSRDGS
jgi:hypothetical protein